MVKKVQIEKTAIYWITKYVGSFHTRKEYKSFYF